MSTIKLSSSDGKVFEVPEKVANMSLTVESIITDVGNKAEIPLPNVTGTVLAKIMEYCQYFVNAKEECKEGDAPKPTEDQIKTWEQEYLQIEQSVLFDVILAANYMNIKELLDLTTKHVASMIKGKTPEQIRILFGIKNDFTPEEEEEVRRENQWAFE
jgi:S-phase kinase-associated protein 1